MRGNHCKLQTANIKLQIGRRSDEHAAPGLRPSPLSPLPSPLSSFSAGRRGVSLLEVLVSMFIILVGLLGVASLLPVARHNIVETAKRNRGAECGRAVLQDIRIRSMANPARWFCWYDANNPYPGWKTPFNGGWTSPWSTPLPVNEAALEHYQSYVIDPLYITAYLRDNPSATPAQIVADTARFPYSAAAAVFPSLHLARASLDLAPTGAQWSYFDRLFNWPDDQIFEIPADKQARATRLVDSAGVGQFEGNYSWMTTVLPGVGGGGVLDGTYEVSVAVFYQRDFSPPSNPLDPAKPGERSVTVHFDRPGCGGGYGGGDVLLEKLPGDPAGTLDLRENEWMLVMAWRNLGGTWRKAFKWYRVAWIEEQNPATPNQRFATLVGDDWPLAWRVDANEDGTLNWPSDSADTVLQGVGVICTGVIGVYTQTM